jgi:hypothetical protein
MMKKWFRVKRRDIAAVQFIIEGYDGLATVSTLDPYKAVIQVSIMSDFVADVTSIIDDLKKNYEIEEIINF